MKATFGGKVTLSDLDPPNSYRISGEGSGGVAGFAKGGATVRLEAEGPDVTVLHYEVDAQIGGKLAQLGVAADQFHREETGGRILCFVWTSCWRGCSGSCGSGAQGLVGQADWRGLATVVACDASRARSPHERANAGITAAKPGLLALIRATTATTLNCTGRD